MRIRNKGLKNNRSTDRFRLDIHDPDRRILDRMKWNSSEKNKAVLAINKIKDQCNITEEEIKQMTEDILIAEAYEQRRIKNPEPIRWTRDEKGRIISPFSKRI